MKSKKFSLNKAELLAIGRGLLVAVVGAALTYVEQEVGQFDFGTYTPVVVAVNSVLVNAGRKFLQGK